MDKIIVHEGSRDEDGIRRQEIEIYYSFVGKLDFSVYGRKKVPVRVNYSDWNEKNFYANRASLSYMSIDRSVMGGVAPFWTP